MTAIKDAMTEHNDEEHNDEAVKQLAADVMAELITRPRSTTVADLLRERAARGEALATLLLEVCDSSFLNSTIEPD